MHPGRRMVQELEAWRENQGILTGEQDSLKFAKETQTKITN